MLAKSVSSDQCVELYIDTYIYSQEHLDKSTCYFRDLNKNGYIKTERRSKETETVRTALIQHSSTTCVGQSALQFASHTHSYTHT